MRKQVVEIIPQEKLNIVKELVELINSKKTVLIVDISGIPGSQFQLISKKLRGKAIIKVPKRNLFYRAIEKSGKKLALKLKDNINGVVAVLFSDLDAYELAGVLKKNQSPAKAKAGQIAPLDIEVPEGPTDMVPGPAISELGALGIQIQIQGGKIHIKAPKVVAQEGKAISQGAADILAKLNILPFTIGFTPLSAYDKDTDKVYINIKIDTEETIESLLEAYGKALPFAVGIGYMSKDTVSLMIQKAGIEEGKLIRVITGEPEPVAVPVETAEEKPKEEIKPEEKKEEPVSFGTGFF